ncbi:MAG: N-6 DNA methylase [Planctomycetaceae bacterium]|nr:N-6 DNA methylase [Planctomycetaceae bacterium]
MRILNGFSIPYTAEIAEDTEQEKERKILETDVELLNLVESWRIELAKDIVLRNENISLNDLNAVVRKIICNVIFLRIVESKGIENVRLFSSVNSVCSNLSIEDNLKSILSSQLDFSVLPAEILGNIYEQILDKTLFLRHVKGCREVVVEAKSKVRKTGGVFYTPQYIVKFIVSNTVGKIIANKTPDEIAQLKIVDPACGAGSMLAGAYQFILDYHLEYYTNEKNIKSALKKKKIYESGNKKYTLTIDEKRRILLNNIFGVDIDDQAVAVTKLSLYLKLLENEGNETCANLLRFSEPTEFTALLSSLENNIKTGNSLIGTDFYQHDFDLSEEKQLRVKCFDWDKEFPDIFANGGFDVVIGNPPYYNVQSFGAGDEQATYIQNKYPEIWQDKSDILFYFIYKALQISKSEIGYITSNAFLFSDKASKLRDVILSDGRFSLAVNFERYEVFSDASISSGIFIFNGKHKNNIPEPVWAVGFALEQPLHVVALPCSASRILKRLQHTIKAAVFKNKNATVKNVTEFINDDKNYFFVTLNRNKVFALVDSQTSKLIQKIDGEHFLLRDLFFIGRGMETGANDVFLFNNYPSQFPKRFIKKRISGENITRYCTKEKMGFMLYFEDVERFEDLPASIQNHLTANAKQLKNRADKKRRRTAKWWNYTFPLHKELYRNAQICCSYRNQNNEFILNEDRNSLCLSNMTVIFATNPNLSLKYLLAILNSKLFKWRYQYLAKQTGNGIFEYMPNGLGKFPIPSLNLAKKSDKIAHDRFVKLVDQMLQLKHKQTAQNSPPTKIITRQINTIDKQIDKAVYKLYGLNDEEIKIIDKTMNSNSSQ